MCMYAALKSILVLAQYTNTLKYLNLAEFITTAFFSNGVSSKQLFFAIVSFGVHWFINSSF